jgi:hypothetical protein
VKVTINTSQATISGAVQHAVEFDLPDDASTSSIEAATEAALEAHQAVVKCQQAWARANMDPETRAQVERLEAEAARQPRPPTMKIPGKRGPVH